MLICRDPLVHDTVRAKTGALCPVPTFETNAIALTLWFSLGRHIGLTVPSIHPKQLSNAEPFADWRILVTGQDSWLRGLDLDYRSRLLHLRLLPLSFFLEYLDLLFFFGTSMARFFLTSPSLSSFPLLERVVVLPVSIFVSFPRGPLPFVTLTSCASAPCGTLSLSLSVLPTLLLPSSRNLKPFFSLVFSIFMPRMMSGLGV